MVVGNLMETFHVGRITHENTTWFKCSSYFAECSRNIGNVFQNSVHENYIKTFIRKWKVLGEGFDQIGG
ncbi:hypothetical protein D3C83_158160 [compost metagenome]